MEEVLDPFDVRDPERGCAPQRAETLPKSIDLAAFMIRFEMNARAEFWPGCYAAIEDLRREAHLARPELWSYEEKLRATPEQIGLSLRVSNTLSGAGYGNVVDLLYAKRSELAAIDNVGPTTIEAIRTCLVKLLAGTRDEAVAMNWPRP
jgi:DNA-directed RNA polymerase alpha subunit